MMRTIVAKHLFYFFLQVNKITCTSNIILVMRKDFWENLKTAYDNHENHRSYKLP